MHFECEKVINGECRIRKVRFNVDGEYCMTCGSDKRIRLWQPYSGRLLRTYAGHGDEVADVAASCDSAHLLSAGQDRTAIMWDVSNGAAVRRLRYHAAPLTCITYNEESTMAVSGARDNRLACWDLRSRDRDPVQTLDDARDSITCVVIRGHEIFAGSADCRARRYDLRAARLVADFLGAPVSSLAPTPDTACYVAGCADDAVRLMDVATGEMLQEYVGHRAGGGSYETEAVLTHDAAVVVSGSMTGHLHAWDLLTAKQLAQVSHSARALQSLAAHPKRAMLLTAAADTVKLWAYHTMEPLTT